MTNMNRRSVLSIAPLLAIAATVPGLAGCPGQTPAMILSDAEMGVADAQIAIATINTGVEAYFAVKPNPALETQIENAVTDTQAALRLATTALGGATSITDGNVQAALTAFGNAYAALMALVSQIGIQTAPASIGKANRGPNGVLYVPAPRLLSAIKTAVATPPVGAAPAAK
jgi:hypothetical protein